MTIPTNFRPMLACDYRKVITKPASVLYSEKLNGIRCVFFGGNETFLNEVGYTKRSTSKIGKSKVEALGSIIVTKEGTCFSVGSGFTFEERIMLWKIRDTLLGKYAKIKYTSYSYKNVPLQPIFICFRNKIDM